MQLIQLIGRLGQDCKVIDHNGRKFVSFSVACDDDYKDGQGVKVDRTVWYECTMDSTAVSNYLKKGTQVFIQGKPRQELYQSERDQKWYGKIRVAVGKLQLLGSASTTTAGNDLPPASSAPANLPASGPRPIGNAPSSSGESDDLPF